MAMRLAVIVAPVGTRRADRTKTQKAVNGRVRTRRKTSTVRARAESQVTTSKHTPSAAFATLDDAEAGLRSVGYLADRPIAVAALLAAQLEKPLLVEGPAGVGKTELARAMAQAQGRTLLRLQCYEGIDESRALYEWEYAKQLLYTQLLRDKVGSVVDETGTLAEAIDKLAGADSVFFSERFLLPRPLLQAIRSDVPCLLLIDEVDKSDPEFEAFLLEVLSDFAVTIPELGTLRATLRPQVVLTSNAARELSDALKRRCLHLSIAFPDRARELAIVRARVPGVDDALARSVVGAVQRLRTFDLRKAPSISEVIDWTRALGLLGKGVVDERVLADTLGVLVKHKDDHALALAQKGTLALAAAESAQGPD
jgi:MoxR-like ATPase